MDISLISACATCLLSGGCEVPAENSWMTTSDKQAASGFDTRCETRYKEGRILDIRLVRSKSLEIRKGEYRVPPANKMSEKLGFGGMHIFM